MPSSTGAYEFRLFVNNARVATSPRVGIDASLSPIPTASSLSPATAVAGGPAFTLTVSGSNFRSSSVIRWNGAARPTTFTNTSQLKTTIGASDIGVAGTAQVTVFTPAPGGGQSSALTFAVQPAPTLTVSATTVNPGTAVTVTLTGGFGGSNDWLALAPASSPNTTYLQFTYLGTGVTTRTWTVTMPGTPGPYQFRLINGGSFARMATSPTVTVTASVLTVGVATVGPGASVTVTLTNGAGGSSDWLALAATGTPGGSYLQYTYVGAGVTTRGWSVVMPATAGTYEFRLLLNGTNTVVSTSTPVTVIGAPPPTGSLSPASAAAGGAAFTLTVNGSGFNAASVVRWNGADRATTFVSGAQLRATIPAADLAVAGIAQVAVFTPAPGGLSSALPFSIVGAPALSVSHTAVTGGASVTVTLTSGYGGLGDWLALAPTTAGNTFYLQWTYIATGVTTRTWTVAMPSTPGTYEFRLFPNNNYTRAATSPPVTVQ